MHVSEWRKLRRSLWSLLHRWSLAAQGRERSLRFQLTTCLLYLLPRQKAAATAQVQVLEGLFKKQTNEKKNQNPQPPTSCFL